MTILEKYRQSIRHTKVTAKQQAVFRACTSHKLLTAVDTETTGVEWGVPTYLRTSGAKLEDITTADVVEKRGPVVFGISMAVEVNETVNLFWGRLGTPLFKKLVKFIGRVGPKVCHNARFDIRVLAESGIVIARDVECTYTMSRIYWDRRKKHSLQSLTEIICPELSDWEEPIKNEMRRLRNKFTRAGHEKDYVNYSFLPDEMVCPYAMMDAFMCLMLHQYLTTKVTWK